MLKLKRIHQKGYEQVVEGTDPDRNFHAIISVHSTALGPSLGGVRIRPFKSKREALQEVLNLSRAMTLKAAVSKLKLGGGKAVLIADPFQDKTRGLFLALGEMIESLGGRYIAAEDSGITPKDLDIVSEKTRHLTGATAKCGGSGDPSYTTARGVVAGMEVALKHRSEYAIF